MKLVVCGGRDLDVTVENVDKVAHYLLDNKVSEVVSGGQRGGDRIGELAAYRLGIPVKSFPAGLGKFGKAAGPIRNQEMADYCDAVLALPGKWGTTDMIRKAEKLGKSVTRFELAEVAREEDSEKSGEAPLV